MERRMNTRRLIKRRSLMMTLWSQETRMKKKEKSRRWRRSRMEKKRRRK